MSWDPSIEGLETLAQLKAQANLECLRDKFAMAALQGQKLPENKTEAATLARLCYFIADAMMARRDK